MVTPRRRLETAIVLLLGSALPAWAEVMDMVPSPAEIWRWAVGHAVVAAALGRVHPLLGLMVALVPSVAFATLTEKADPFVGPSIVREAGWAYVVHAYAATALPLLGCILGAAARSRARRRSARRDLPEPARCGADPP